MDRLVECLKTIDSSSLPDASERHLNPIDHRLIREICIIASYVLITDTGGPNFDEMDRLYKEHGYIVVPCELGQAYIQTKKGIIVFG